MFENTSYLGPERRRSDRRGHDRRKIELAVAEERRSGAQRRIAPSRREQDYLTDRRSRADRRSGDRRQRSVAVANDRRNGHDRRVTDRRERLAVEFLPGVLVRTP